MIPVGRRLLVAMRVASIEIKLDMLARSLERNYRPDQPRAPSGTPIGGQWIDDVVHVAATTRCDGFSSGCQNGGSFGSSGMVRIGDKMYCWDCAIKFLGIQELPRGEQLEMIKRFDKTYQD
jgi:hypothetical protein